MQDPFNQLDCRFTQIEFKLLKLTADGQPHYKSELLACLDDVAATNKDVHNAVYRLRAKLLPMGQDLIAQSFGRGSKYRRIRLLVPSS